MNKLIIKNKDEDLLLLNPTQKEIINGFFTIDDYHQFLGSISEFLNF